MAITAIDVVRIQRWRKKHPEAAREMYEVNGRKLREWLDANPSVKKRIERHGGEFLKTFSKLWRIRDPRGRSYEFVNLSEFVRKHEYLFDSEDLKRSGANKNSRAVLALGKLRPTREGRIRGSWKGWTWGPTSKVSQNGHDILQRR